MRLAPDDRTLLDFDGEFLVVCPRCSAQARVRDRGSVADPRISLTCPHCGLSQFWAAAQPGMRHSLTAADPQRYPLGVVATLAPGAGRVRVGGTVDWYFHLPLWLQIGCCGETLWAYHAAHLDFIENYVRATLREHARGEHGWSNQSLANRLPRWMTDAKNRDNILKCVEKLREKL